MKFLFDLFPVALFFGIFRWSEGHKTQAAEVATRYLGSFVSSGTIHADLAPILLATSIAILASIFQIGWLFLRRQKISPMIWISVAIICIFGGLTIYFQNDAFIKWKPTLIYWVFAIALLVGRFLLNKDLLRTAMGEQISLPEEVWRKLNLAWIIFFGVMGILNLYVAFNFDLSTWVNFKAIWFTVLIVAFSIGQALFLSKYIKETP